MSHTVTTNGVLPRYIYNYSDALSVQTRMTVAFQGTCKCGWQGRWKQRRIDAMDEYQRHKQHKHGDAG